MESLVSTLQITWQRYEITAADSIVLGISGGIDSMVLLDLVAKVHPIGKITVAHIDHGMRPDSSSDAEFVHHACQGYGITFDSVRVDIQQIAQAEKTSVETAGRIVRY